VTRGEFQTLLILLYPFAPHISEELWEELNYDGMVHEVSWPQYDESKIIDENVEIAIQINGKVKATALISTGSTQSEAKAVVFELDEVKRILEGKEIIKEIFVPDRIYNIVLR
jgi:leucyl-tRNA synthetase